MMSILSRLTSIQAKLLVLFLVSVLFTIAVVLIFNGSVRNLALASADTSLLVEAEHLASEIDDFNQRNLRTFAIASSLPALEAFYKSDPEAQHDPEIREAIRNTLISLNVRPYSQFNVSSFALLDLEGNNIFDTLISYEGLYEGDQDYFEYPLLSGSEYVSTVSFDPLRGGTSFYYSVPIRDSIVPNPPLGVLRVQISVSVIQNILLEGADTETHVVLVDENHLRLLDNRHTELNFRSVSNLTASDIQILRELQEVPPLSATQLNVPIPDIEPYLDYLAPSQIFTGHLSISGDASERIAVIPLETQPWILFYGRDAGQFYAPVNQQTQGIFLLSGFLTIGAVLFALVFARSLGRPITQLTDIALIAAKGNLDVRADVSSRDEVGTLANAFNTMIDELQQVKNNLQQRVDEQTTELTESNRKLKSEIEERKRLEKTNLQLALESERTRILADFIQNVSHEFKTPLSIINIQSHLLSRIVGESVDRRVNEIITQSRSIETLVNEMVMMSRLDSQDYVLAYQKLYVDEFIQSICLAEEQDFLAKNIDLETRFNADDSYINHNGQMLSTAIKYILDNAIHFTPEGGHIIVETRRIDDDVRLQIIDNGIGISEYDLPRVFERFYRVDRARTIRGFGLGLPIARRIIEHARGTIQIDSVLHSGTTVTITLPLIKRHSGAQTTSSE